MIQVIIGMRGFAFTKHQYENAARIEDVPTGALMELIKDIEFGLVATKKKKKDV